MKLLYILLLVCSAASCMAQPPKTNTLADDFDCTDINVSPKLDDCIYKEIMNSKTLLSDELLSFEKRAKNIYATDMKLGKELIEIVRGTQDAWIAFRDRSCKIEAFQIEKKTPAYITTINNCIIRMNNGRIEKLKNLLN